MNEKIEILVLTAPAALMLCAWAILLRRRHALLALSSLWIILLATLAVTGFLQWNPEMECTRLYATLAPTSTIWLTGPLLMLTVQRGVHLLWAVLGTVALSILSFFGCFFLMAETGQLWGM